MARSLPGTPVSRNIHVPPDTVFVPKTGVSLQTRHLAGKLATIHFSVSASSGPAVDTYMGMST
jgi:hypothetical protein